MKTVNVLVTGIGGPIAQGIMMGLHQLDHIRIIGADRRALTSGHHFCDRTYQIPRYTDPSAYKHEILNIIEQENIVAVFPGLPEEITLYDEFRFEIPAEVALPKSKHFQLQENKVEVYQLLEAEGLEKYVPRYYSFTENEDLRQILKERFKDETHIVVKPAMTYGAIGSAILTDREHYLKAISENKKKILNIEDYYDIAAFNHEERFIMRLLESQEYSVDVYMHLGELVVAIPRERTGASSGIVLEGKVVYNEALIQAASDISKKLITDGFMNLQFFEREDGYVLTYVNPRFAGSQVMSLGANVNFPEIFLQYEVLSEKMVIEPEWETKMFRYRVPKFYKDGQIQDPPSSLPHETEEDHLAPQPD